MSVSLGMAGLCGAPSRPLTEMGPGFCCFDFLGRLLVVLNNTVTRGVSLVIETSWFIISPFCWRSEDILVQVLDRLLVLWWLEIGQR